MLPIITLALSIAAVAALLIACYKDTRRASAPLTEAHSYRYVVYSATGVVLYETDNHDTAVRARLYYDGTLTDTQSQSAAQEAV